VRQLTVRRPAAAILLGDLDLPAPLEDVFAPVLEHTALWWVAGNHDGDRVEWHDRLFESALGDRGLHGQVVEIAGVRVAGLNGVFRGKVWDPIQEAEPRFRTRAEYLKGTPKNTRWRGGLPMKHRVTIFPEDLDHLAKLRADVLVCHEAPGNHRFGFPQIDAVAEAMGVHTIVHGHHHQNYTDTLSGRQGLITVHGVGLGCIRDLAGHQWL